MAVKKGAWGAALGRSRRSLRSIRPRAQKTSVSLTLETSYLLGELRETWDLSTSATVERCVRQAARRQKISLPADLGVG